MILALLLWACGGPRHYDTGLFRIATGFRAKEACSCLFVQGLDPALCTEITRVDPDLARFRVDDQARTVTARVLGGWAETARYVDARHGCVLE